MESICLIEIDFQFVLSFSTEAYIKYHRQWRIQTMTIERVTVYLSNDAATKPQSTST